MDKQNERIKNRHLMIRFLSGSKRFFIAGMICACFVAFFDLINPKIIQYFVDALVGTPASASSGLMRYIRSLSVAKNYSAMAALVVVMAMAAAAFRYAFQYLNAKGAEALTRRMRDLLFEHLTRTTAAWRSAHRSGDLLQRCTSDVETIKVFVSEQMTKLFQILLMIAFSLYFMISIHPVLALIAAAYIPVMVGGSIYFHRRIGESFETVDREEGKLSAIVQENLTGVRVVRAFGKEAYEQERFKKQNHGYTNLWVHLMKIMASFWVSGNVIATLRDLIVMSAGIIFCVNGSLTAGEFTAFISYNALLAMPVRGLGRIIAELSKAGISLGRLREIMEAPTEPETGTAKPNMNQTISFNHVSFAYRKQMVLEDVSMVIPAGATIGIFGATGSGKSTLAMLLDRFYEPDRGTITIGGTPLSEIERSWLRDHVGIVSQEPYLFSGTLKDNILLAADQTSALDHVTAMAGLTHTVETFPQGYETYVGQRGITLSGGQKQRTAIAQMLIRRTPIMIFDDSFSALDAETDEAIRRRLRAEPQSATRIYISHRVAALMHADRIYVLDHGRIVEQGTHEELIRQGGLYAKSAALQMRGEEKQ
ncbi:MAG: ABC transporter ATP-binding protein [Catenisphaera adipataccumulans]|jgi:ATP-binding cassette subfamily B protein|uniref:ABC transporter ATP-binding protein n=1 Tax=Catenisphaera adipataccumulans TaxID=700500 RepID=UPI003D8AD96B